MGAKTLDLRCAAVQHDANVQDAPSITMVTPPPGREFFARGAETMSRVLGQAHALADVVNRQASALLPTLRPTLPPRLPTDPLTLGRDAAAYALDASQRALLFWDTMRR